MLRQGLVAYRRFTAFKAQQLKAEVLNKGDRDAKAVAHDEMLAGLCRG
jgi:hypothetical protein